MPFRLPYRSAWARSPRRLAAVVLSAGVLGCDGSTAPAPAVEIGIAVVRVEPPVLSELPQGAAQIECTVELRAEASGSGSAEWLAAMVRYFIGEQGLPPVDSVEISSAEVSALWSHDAIAGDSAQISRLTFVGAVPFGVEIEFAYEPEGARQARSAVVAFDCGPVVEPGTPLPEVQSVDATAVGGVLVAGGALDVTFTATAAAGIWQSLIAIEGDCVLQVLFPERLHTSVTRTERLTIPADCEPGSTLTVSAFVQDAGLRQAGASASAPLIVADRSPPSITPVLLSPYLPNQPQPLEGTFFQGDTIGIRFAAQDDHRVAWLVWVVQPFGLRDSVAVPAGGSEPVVMIPLDMSWSGPFELWLTARDASDNEVLRRSAPGALRVLPSVSPPMAADTVSGDVVDLEIDESRGRLYVLQRQPSRVAFFDLATLQPLGTVSLPAVPNAMDLTPGGDSLLVTLAGRPSLGIIDLRQASPAVSELALALDPSLEQFGDGVAAMAGGKTFIVLRSALGSAGNRLLELDLATGTQRDRSDISATGVVGGADIQRSRNGSRAAIESPSGFRLYERSADAFGPEVSSGTTGPQLSLDDDGSRIARGLSVFDAAGVFLRTVDAPVGGAGATSHIESSGARLFHAWPRIGVIASSASDGALEFRLLPSVAAEIVRTSLDGRTVVGARVLPGASESVLVRYTLP